MPGISEPPVVATIDGLDNGVRKPRVITMASPAPGHTEPVLRVTEALVERGYDVTMLAGAGYSPKIESIGAKAVVIEEMMTVETMTKRAAVPQGDLQRAFDLEYFFMRPTGHRLEVVNATLEKLQQEDPDHDIVIVTESFFLGTHPLYLGSPLPKGFTKRPRIISLHALTYMVKSIDTAPFGMGMLPDSSPEGRAKMAQLRKEALEGPWKGLIDLDEKNMRSLGAWKYEREMLWELLQTTHDLSLQMCHPALEYDRPDWHPKVQFIGSLPPPPLKKNIVYPDFWDSITNGEKRVIMVSQGTIATDYNQLLIPTLHALADRDDVIVLGVLGIKGATLPADVKIPKNAHVVDYLSYDAILPHASVFVFNAGYGGFIHGSNNGVPMVLAGISEDKPEVAARAEYAGIAVNLRTADPTQQQLSEAVNKILSDPSFKKKASKIQRENVEMRAMDGVESAILKMAALGYADAEIEPVAV